MGKLAECNGDEGQQLCIRPTRRRYLILALYALCSMEKSFQWINLSAVTNKVAAYYEVDNMAVNWTSVLFMVTFIPLILPTSWLIERIGLRKAILIGSLGISLGALVKCFSCPREGVSRAGDYGSFWVVIVGQIVVSLSEQFIFCVPARIASVWFPDHQVSLATGFGIFGNQCGIALGFIIPQALLAHCNTRAQIGAGLWQLFAGTAALSWLTLLALWWLFDDAPAQPPGGARLAKILEEQARRSQDGRRPFGAEMRSFGALILELILERNCSLLTLAYGLNVGTGYAIQTLLNQMISSALASNPTGSAADTNAIVGRAGMAVIVCGMAGALFWGHLCDRTRKYLLMNKLLHGGAVASMCLFGLALKNGEPWAIYSASALLGFHLIGYTVVGLDTAVELTYPAPELVSTSIMNLSPQIFGSGITFVGSHLVDNYDTDASIACLSLFVGAALLITMAVREQLNRQAAAHQFKSASLAPAGMSGASGVSGASGASPGSASTARMAIELGLRGQE